MLKPATRKRTKASAISCGRYLLKNSDFINKTPLLEDTLYNYRNKTFILRILHLPGQARQAIVLKIVKNFRRIFAPRPQKQKNGRSLSLYRYHFFLSLTEVSLNALNQTLNELVLVGRLIKFLELLGVIHEA